MGATLSLCMIVRDEERVLARALDGVSSDVDEIVIADTGSRDGTVALAKRYTDKVFDFEWCDDFAAARNFSFSKASCEFVMWLDADDIVTPENAELLKKLKDRLETETPDTVMCRYDVAFDKKGRATYSFIRERILRREGCPPWQGCVHECVSPFGKLMFSHFTVRHGGDPFKNKKGRNLAIYQKNVSAGVKLDPRHTFYYGRELVANGLFAEAEGVLKEAVEGEGWAVNKIEASKALADCYLSRGREEDALNALLGSFRFGEPRASVMCKLGAVFKRRGMLKEAIYWYTAALSAKDFSAYGDFDQPECRGMIPLVELTACYWADGESRKSFKCHLAAEELDPEHPSVRYNREFFKARGMYPPRCDETERPSRRAP